MIQAGQSLENIFGGAPVEIASGGPLEMISGGRGLNAILAARLIGQGLDVNCTIGNPTLTERFGLDANGLRAGPGGSLRMAGQEPELASRAVQPAFQPDAPKL